VGSASEPIVIPGDDHNRDVTDDDDDELVAQQLGVVPSLSVSAGPAVVGEPSPEPLFVGSFGGSPVVAGPSNYREVAS
jgi:hypothetical protein